MNANEYLKLTDNTCKHFPDGLKLSERQADFLHALLGISGESGELVDGFKKHLIYNKPVDIGNLIEEAGDILWYMALLFRTIGVPFEQVMLENIDKLKARYPDKYSDEAALARADKNV